MSLFKYDGSVASATPEAVLHHGGTAGADTLSGTAGRDAFWIGDNDRAVGGEGDDTYYFQGHNISVAEAVGGGVDKIVAWQNIDLSRFAHIENLAVGGDNIYAAGDARDNVIEGMDGAQQIYGGKGQDVLIGGAGADTFIVVKGEGNDVIQDFASVDRLRLKAGFTHFDQVKAALTQVGADAKLDLGGGDALLFRNFAVSDFTAANFQLELDRTTLGAPTFADEFSGPLSIWDAQSNPTGVWRPDYGYQGETGTGSYTLMSNGELQIYTSPYFRGHNGDFPESPFVSNADGTLSIWARPSSNSEIWDYKYTSGLITTRESFTQTYGYFEMRADIPDAVGAWPAFWLLPADGSWPPELDVMETLTRDPNALWTTRHSALGGHNAEGRMSYVPDTADGFHTYGAVWSPTELIFYVDNVEVFRTATPADMNKPMFMLANLALGGWGGALGAGALPAEFKIDYIRAYGLPGASSGGPTPAPTSPAPTSPAPTPPPTTSEPSPSTGGQSLTSAGFGDTLTGGAGADTLVAGNGAEHMTGGAGADVFLFNRVPWNPSEIRDFEVGVDRLDVTALLNGADAAERVILMDDEAGGTKVVVDPDGPGGAWPDYIAHLQGTPLGSVTVASLLGPAPATATPSTPPPAEPAPSPASGQLLTSPGFGAVMTGGDGADTLTAGNGAEQMTGGAGADVFLFTRVPWNPAEILDFKMGVDRLDVTDLLKGAPASERVILMDDGAGGTKVVVDPDGAGGAWPDYIAHLQGVPLGSVTVPALLGLAAQPAAAEPATTEPAASPTPTPAPEPEPAPAPQIPGVSLVSKGSGATTLTGGAGADTLNAGSGQDVLTGGGGADLFVFDNLPRKAARISDFQPGLDHLDFGALLRGVGYAGSDPVADGFIKIVDSGRGSSWIFFDRDGLGSRDAAGTHVVTLEKVTPGAVQPGDWIF